MDDFIICTNRNNKSRIMHIKPAIFLLILFSFSTILQAQKKTREIVQHATLGEVTLVKVYKNYTDEINYEFFEKNTMIEDTTYGKMKAVGEYDKEGVLTWETRFKESYDDPELGIVNIEQEYDEGELQSDYRIKENYNDPDLGTINLVMSFYEGELEETYKIKKQIKKDARLGNVTTEIVYNEDNTKDNEVTTYGTTTIKKSFYENQLTSEIKNYLDEHNNYIRQELEYNGSGKLKKAFYYKNGKKDGLQKYFYTDGIPNLEHTYKNGTKVGVQKSYHSNGTLKEKKTIDENGKTDGEYLLYKYDGTVETKGSYKNGTKTGIWEEYGSRNPNLLKKCTYTKDNAVCEELDYYDHGGYFTIKSITTFTQDKNDYYRNGPFISYYNYEKNLIKEKGAYKNGDKFGPWTVLDEMGNSICNVTYIANDNITDQKFASYSEDGILVNKGSNVPYHSCGGKTTFTGEGYLDRYDAGKISSQKKYFDGKLVSEKMYKQGVLEFERKFKNEEKTGLIAYDDKQRIRYSLRMVSDTTYVEQYNYQLKELKIKDEGFIVEKQKEPYTFQRTITYASGELYAKGIVIVDTLRTPKKIYDFSNLKFSKTGLWKSYYKNGEPESLGEFRYDQPIGEWKSFYENGIIKEKGTYKLTDKPDYAGKYASLKIGIWITYNEDGNVIEEKDYKDG
ncbi:toxin-antitoxin system YwqK family antitoxin, partial [Aquimarina pacifica]|uniref:toxin-antitoxin system YwqK family antitoxin n=1 Tax=Aquimarina pacifica TaxID=1296415 RepID=UPI001377115D